MTETLDSFEYAGLRLAFRERGSGAPLVLVPGSTASSAHHAGELEHFGRRFRAIGIDLPGTGRSARLERWPEEWWDLGAHAVAALVDRLGAGPAVLVGTSGGGVVALLAAALHPGAVRAVIADSTVPRYDPDFLRRAAVLRKLETAPIVAFWAHGHGADWRAVVEADSDFLERIGRGGGDPFRGRLALVRCPVLLTGSLGDELIDGVGPGTIEMARAIPGSQVFLTREGKHPMIWTRPAEFRGAADAFLGALPAAADR